MAALRFLKIPSALDECWAMDRHYDHDRGTRTRLGDLVHAAKYEDGPHARAAADELCAEFRQWCVALAGMPKSPLRAADVVVAVPALPRKPFDLPLALAAAAADGLNRPLERALVRKWKSTARVKDLPVQRRAAVLKDVFRVDGDVRGCAVAVVDDLVMSTATLSALAERLRRAGAATIVGLAATRATTGLASRF